MNNMRKRSNNNNQRRHGGGGHSGGGQRRYNNNSSGGGGNRGGSNDGQNLARQKHHATQMREKHMNHARDAQNNGDRVDVEYYLQHVDHYNRVLNDIAVIENERHEKMREQQQANQPQGGEGQQQGGDQNNQGGGNDQNQGGNDDQNNGGGNMEEPITPGNQPRMTRGPRHNNPPRQDQNDPNGAKAANANHEEIPLPGGVLGAV